MLPHKVVPSDDDDEQQQVHDAFEKKRVYRQKDRQTEERKERYQWAWCASVCSTVCP